MPLTPCAYHMFAMAWGSLGAPVGRLTPPKYRPPALVTATHTARWPPVHPHTVGKPVTLSLILVLDAQALATLHSFGGVMNLHDYQALGGELFVADIVAGRVPSQSLTFTQASSAAPYAAPSRFSGLSKLAVCEDRLYVFDEDQ